jgi:hypothetical protein
VRAYASTVGDIALLVAGVELCKKLLNEEEFCTGGAASGAREKPWAEARQLLSYTPHCTRSARGLACRAIRVAAPKVFRVPNSVPPFGVCCPTADTLAVVPRI